MQPGTTMTTGRDLNTLAFQRYMELDQVCGLFIHPDIERQRMCSETAAVKKVHLFEVTLH